MGSFHHFCVSVVALCLCGCCLFGVIFLSFLVLLCLFVVVLCFFVDIMYVFEVTLCLLSCFASPCGLLCLFVAVVYLFGLSVSLW